MKSPFTARLALSVFFRRRLSASLLLGLLLNLALSSLSEVLAQFPRNETFRNATAPNFTFLGAARLTGTGAAGADAVGSGYLRLTDAAFNQAGSVVDNVGFDAPNGFTISFEFFSYGGTGADGFSVFLVDEAGQPAGGVRIGASGGSLGYAQKTVAPIAPGVSRGYLGIGIDEFGNYANPTEGRNGGPGFTPDAVSVRGPGDGSGLTDYEYLTGTALNQLGFSLDVPTVRAQPGSPNYRRAFIDVSPVTVSGVQTYQITVRIQNGNQVRTTVSNFTVTSPPDRLRLGFSGSTGGSTNIHEIRNLNIVRAPFANDDLASTLYDQPITINAISNDVFPGTGFQLGSLDLDFATPGVQNTFTIPGQGTFTASNSGQVTFAPIGNFAGTVTIPYTVNDVLDQSTSTSSPANIIIVVQGADISTSISGPTTANPNSTITYSVTTSNLGPVTAANVAPTLQLSPNLPAGSVTPSSGSYNASSGLVTFDPVASLASGSSVTNSVTLVLPASGTLTGTAVSNNSVPDPVLTNNTATITTIIGGVANVSTACASPGKDGPLTVSGANVILNTYYAGSQSVAAGATSVRVGSVSQGSSAAVAVGDVVLIMQMQGADMNTSNTDAYGDGVAGGEASGVLSTNLTAGRYEYAIVSNVAISGSDITLTLNKGLAYSYENVNFADISGNQAGQRRFQVIRVPQYSTLTVSGSITGSAWNGSTGGVLVLDVAGKTILTGNSASLNMTARGFRGGGGKRYNGIVGYNAGDVRNLALNTVLERGAHGSKGEGIAGTPQYVYNGATTTLDTGSEGYREGSNAQGAPGNAGGGANSAAPTTNTGNAGGGGGSNAGKGGIGGYGAGTSGGGSGARASGGAPFAGSSSLLVMGGGGGAGSTNATTANEYQSSGGIGGGIIILRTGSVTGTGTVEANGGNAPGAPTLTNGGGGGGAGGTIVLLATPPDGVAQGLNGLIARANGGRGGDANTSSNTSYGPGGGGGGGFVYASSGLNSVATTAGANGGTRNSTVAYGSTPGNAGSSNTATSAAIPNTIAGSAGCLPTLTVALRTSTPTRTRVGAPGSAVNPATYILTVSNTGGEASDLEILASLPATIFSYDNSFTPEVTLTLADNTTPTPTGFSAPAAGSGGSTPTFTLASLPAGARISITFQATIAATANDGQIYNASAQVSYLNPLRIAANGRVSNTQNYYAGTDPINVAYGTPTGTDYTGNNPSNTFEDVTITRPLPVELTRFEAAAVKSDAVLTWTTATELNNDRFEIERSFNASYFERVGTERGQGTSARATNYRFTDAGAGNMGYKVAYYRLRQIDTDGTVSVSPVRVVKFTNFSKANVALYPNPAPGQTTLDLTDLPAGTYQVRILDITGRQVGTYALEGANKHPLSVKDLPQGSYVVRIVGNGVSLAVPLVRN